MENLEKELLENEEEYLTPAFEDIELKDLEEDTNE